MNAQNTFVKNDVKAGIFLERASTFLSKLSPQSVDLIVTSPPYFVGKEYDMSKSWEDFSTEIRAVTPLMVDALKPGGSICWQVGNHVHKGVLTPLDALIVTEMQKIPQLKLRNRIVWTFGHGTHANTRFSGRHETILWYTHGECNFFDLDTFRIPQKYPGKTHYKGPKKGQLSGNPLGKNPGDFWDIGDIWNIPNVKSKHIEKTDHPCQFPTALVRRLVRGMSPKGGTVVDPYMGSGSAGVAALLEGRNFMGCDISFEYLEIANNRLQQTIDGVVSIREDVPVRTPDPKERVSTRPSHFVKPLEM